MFELEQIEKFTQEQRDEWLMVEVLPPVHTSPETAYVVKDYPYGFRLRCQKRYWIEFKPGKVGGFRLVTQTSNPKRSGLVWNKPKAGTYCDILVMGFNALGHIVSDGFRVGEYEATLDRFLAAYATGIAPEGFKVAEVARAYARGMAKLTWNVRTVAPGEQYQTLAEQQEIIRKVATIEYAKMTRSGEIAPTPAPAD